MLKANSGSDYSYLDADGKADGFAAGPGTLAETDNALGHTLQQVYAGGDDVGYLMYNDQDPREKKSYYKAHAKGLYGWGPGGGFWGEYLPLSIPCARGEYAMRETPSSRQASSTPFCSGRRYRRL